MFNPTVGHDIPAGVHFTLAVGRIPVVGKEMVSVDGGGVSDRQSPLISMRMDE